MFWPVIPHTPVSLWACPVYECNTGGGGDPGTCRLAEGHALGDFGACRTGVHGGFPQSQDREGHPVSKARELWSGARKQAVVWDRR